MLKLTPQLKNAIALGLSIATIGLGSYLFLPGFKLEVGSGLDQLFRLRGQRPAPEEVVIIAMDKIASDTLEQPNDPAKWSRSLHTRLLDRLTTAGSKTVIFDVYFKQRRSQEQDDLLAAAIKRANNVILFAHLERKILTRKGATPKDTDFGQEGLLNLERLIPPTDPIAQAPLAVAPFALPKYPAKVSRFWTFRAAAGDMPNIPTLALHLYNQENLTRLIQTEVPELAPMLSLPLREQVSAMRSHLQTSPDLADQLLRQNTKIERQGLDLQKSQQLRALIEMYRGPNQQLLNFYGPPRSIRTITFDKVLNSSNVSSLDLHNKVVFVGFSEFLQPQQRDNFNTVFSQPNGLDLSGVEIAATAFSNLLHQETITSPSGAQILFLVFLYGVIISAIARLIPASYAILLVLLLATSYTVGVYFLFFHKALLLPFVIPLLVQTPLALFIALFWQYRETRQERNKIRRAFGYYLPEKVVKQLAQSTDLDQSQQELMYGVCMATDAEQYTQLSEQLTPQELSERLNLYYRLLFTPVRKREGVISDVVGDAMLALWPTYQSHGASSTAQLRENACDAALEIIQALEHADPKHALPTRIGLHAGDIMLGNVGAIDHFEYRAVGDIVNTATRIQGLNKQLGTRLIASKEILRDLSDKLLFRELGQFRLVGKSNAIDVVEILGLLNVGHSGCTTEFSAQKTLCHQFAKGLALFTQRQWKLSQQCFQMLLETHPQDGPCKFYIEYCRRFAAQPPNENWNGIIQLQTK